MDQLIISSKRDRRARLRIFGYGFLLSVVAVALMVLFVMDWIDSIDPDIILLPPVVSVVLFAVGVGMLVIWSMSGKCAIDVKSDGVWGTTMTGKDVFLPMNQITKLGKKDNIFCITAGKRKYRFAFLGNVPELREAVLGLQRRGCGNEYRQNSLAQSGNQMRKDSLDSVSRNKVGTSFKRRKGSAAIARHLKRYKKLCDQGIITQEEFERIKRQLLEL